jgi:L-cysteine S-thiosulfotransferase
MVRQHHCRTVWLILLLAACASAFGEATYRVVAGGIPTPLSSAAGDPNRGKAIVANADRGNCLICHAMPIAKVPVFGTVGPDLAGVGSRLSAAQLRLRIVNSKALNPSTSMPAYYKVDGLARVAPEFAGKPILSAQEVEDVVAYLETLTRDSSR